MFKKSVLVVVVLSAALCSGGCVTGVGSGSIRMEYRSTTITCPGVGVDDSALEPEDEEQPKEGGKSSWTL